MPFATCTEFIAAQIVYRSINNRLLPGWLGAHPVAHAIDQMGFPDCQTGLVASLGSDCSFKVGATRMRPAANGSTVSIPLNKQLI